MIKQKNRSKVIKMKKFNLNNKYNNKMKIVLFNKIIKKLIHSKTKTVILIYYF